MSRSLKVKLFISGVSLIVLVLIPLMKNNFNAPVTMIRWREVTWDDFQGLAKPFTAWGAGISSTIYVEFDSTQNKYIGYAAMNNQQSWTKESSIDSDYMLNHEQYHFNITEYYARILNEWIESRKVTYDEVQDKLIELRVRLDSWQYQYDHENNHSLYRGEQRRWEFKIDSLLSRFSPDSGYVSDYYSGGRVFMPTRPEFTKGTRSQVSAYRSYSVEKYGMFLSMVSRQYSGSLSNLMGSFYNTYKSDSLEIKSLHIDSTLYAYHEIAELYDSVEQESIIYRWVYTGDYLFKLTAKYPATSNTDGYKSIANTFIKSFQTIDTRPYWTEVSESSVDTVFIHDVEVSKLLENIKDLGHCWAQVSAAQYGFYGKPIIYDDGSILIPYCNTNHADSLVQELLVAHNGKQYSYDLTEQSYLYLTAEEVGRKEFSIDIGYTTSEQTKNGCLIFFSQSIVIDPKAK